MIGYYNYTVILTYIGTLFGFIGITYTLNGNPYPWNSNLKMALICLMIAGLCDMFDGKIASTMKRTKPEKRFGVQIDSLSDFVCFGALPALIVFQCSDGNFLHILISAVYVLCAMIRLAWFNVDEEQRQDREGIDRESYLGLPVTFVALLLPLCIGGAQILKLHLDVLCPWLILPVAAGFLVPFRIKKPGAWGKIIMTLCGVVALVLVLVGVDA